MAPLTATGDAMSMQNGAVIAAVPERPTKVAGGLWVSITAHASPYLAQAPSAVRHRLC